MDLLCRELVILNDCDLSNNNNRTTGIQMENTSNHRVNTAIDDPIFLDDRCLQNLLKTEDKFITPYFKTIQNDITPNMRKVVTEWMIGVNILFFFFIYSHSKYKETIFNFYFKHVFYF